MFQFPPDSDTPSTPASRRSRATNPSTTPAGPPPTSYTSASFTPKGNPPSSVFGSSQLGAGIPSVPPLPSWKGKAPAQSSPVARPHYPNLAGHRAANPTPGKAFGGTTAFQVPSSSPPGRQTFAIPSDDEYEEDGDYEDDDAMGEVDDQEMEMDDEGPGIAFQAGESFGGSRFGDTFQSSRGTKRSRMGQSLGAPKEAEVAANKETIRGMVSEYASAQDLPSTLEEEDNLILDTERALKKLLSAAQDRTETQYADSVASVAEELADLWSQHGKVVNNTKERERVGPDEDAPQIAKANFLASLLLKLHHPSELDSHANLAGSRYGRSIGLSQSLIHHEPVRRDTPIPKVLLDWMNSHHDPSALDIKELLRENLEGYSAAPDFWEVVRFALIRGKFAQVIKLLRGANFSVADTAREDGSDEPGYTGAELRTVNEQVKILEKVIGSCPAVEHSDWDVKGGDWSLFRRRVSQAMDDLKDFAEGESKDRPDDEDEDGFRETNFGLSGAGSMFGISHASRRAESKVPWTIYENLIDVYKVLLGTPTELIKSATTWVEAAVALTAWWDGEEEEHNRGNLAMSRRSLSRSTRTRQADITPGLAYRQRMAEAFVQSLSDSSMQLPFDDSNPMELGLASIFHNDIDSLLVILKNYSMVVTSAIVDLASVGNWLPDARPPSRDVMNGFDMEDLMVLDYGQENKKKSKKDEILALYADLLWKKNTLKSSDLTTVAEGWELALQVLGRLESQETANERIKDILDNLPLDAPTTADKIISICTSMGFNEHAKNVAERYADSIADNTTNYGTALLYYARAHNNKKIRDVLDLLVSCCLVHSMAYPPTSALDDKLRSFIDSPKKTLTQLAREDVEAAQSLSKYLSGYATIRKFYDLRDDATQGKKLGRKREAAKALVVVIESAVDSIKGGLYDPEVDGVIQVDGLLTLLAEALIFIDQPVRTLNLTSVFTILKAIEDLETSPSLIRQACEAHFRSSLDAYGKPSSVSPSTLLKKSTSALTDRSAFSFAGSSVMGGTSSEGSGVLVGDDVKREWDWRKGFGAAASGEDVCRILRLGIAREIGKAWAEGEM